MSRVVFASVEPNGSLAYAAASKPLDKLNDAVSGLQLEIVEETTPQDQGFTRLGEASSQGLKDLVRTRQPKHVYPVKIANSGVNASFAPLVDSSGATIGRLEQLHVFHETKQHQLHYAKQWKNVIDSDVEYLNGLDQKDEFDLDSLMEPDSKPVSYQHLLEENASLIMQLHKLQEDRLSKGSIHPNSREITLAHQIESNLVALTSKCTPKDLIKSSTLEKVMERIPQVNQKWRGTLEPRT